MKKTKGIVTLVDESEAKKSLVFGCLGIIMAVSIMVGVYIQSLRILTLCSVLGCVLIIIIGFHEWYILSHIPDTGYDEASVRIKWLNKERGQAFIEIDDD